MPDHDMEITFDVEFTKDDVLMVSRDQGKMFSHSLDSGGGSPPK